MKSAVIDIGSNSVRLYVNGKKTIENTQLAENLIHTGRISEEAAERTVNAVRDFYNQALSVGAEKVYAFATEAVRAAENGAQFMKTVSEVGAETEILSPYEEALAGFTGAYSGKGTECVLDIGGASSELSVGNGKGMIYVHSLPLGSVRLKDYSAEREEQERYAKERVKEYGEVPRFDKLIAIGGTLSQLCAVMKELEPYDAEEVDGTVMTRKDVEEAVNRILSVPPEERKKIKGLHPKKIFVAPSGGILALAIMDYLKIGELTVSEKDNLEGYAILRKREV